MKNTGVLSTLMSQKGHLSATCIHIGCLLIILGMPLWWSRFVSNTWFGGGTPPPKCSHQLGWFAFGLGWVRVVAGLLRVVAKGCSGWSRDGSGLVKG